MTIKQLFWTLALALTLPAQSFADTILKSDFNASDAALWSKATASAPRGCVAAVTVAPVGTIDTANSAQPSGALLLTVKNGPAAPKQWKAALVSGLLPVSNQEANADKLTLSFSLSASLARPVTVSIASFNAARHRTGGMKGVIYPAAPNFLQRYALDLATLKPSGTGKFQPTAPFVQFAFEVSGAANEADLPAGEAYAVRVDNVNYASPAYYVSPKGSDSSDGRTEKTAFATPQKALDLAQPGDIVLLMEGTYKGGQVAIASFQRPGAPDAWIVLKNYPGQHPLLTSTGWNIVSIAKGSRSQISKGPALAYLEVRGLHVRGEGDVAKQKYPEAMNKADSRTNSNGIAVDCRSSADVFHDIRIADNLVEFCPGCGIGTDADRVTIENNTCRSNCWPTIYAPSGISVMGARDFDDAANIYKRLIRNNVCCHNQTYEKWQAINRYSDGNGIILDVNQGTDEHPTSHYSGRTLVQSNLCYDNGGSGIHTVTAYHVDIINNTVYLNSASVHLEYGEIFTYGSTDVRIMNNILVAPVANVAAGEKPEPVNSPGGKNSDIIMAHNIYFGGNIPPVMGEGDIIADPRFVNPSVDDRVADFHLRPDSPALKKGLRVSFLPFLDLDGRPRGMNPDCGAYQALPSSRHPQKVSKKP